MSRLVSYFSLTLLFTLCACFVDYAFVIVVIKESYYYYYYYYNDTVRACNVCLRPVSLRLITPPPIGEQNIAMSVSVCVCVCLSAIIHTFETTRPIFTKCTLDVRLKSIVT